MEFHTDQDGADATSYPIKPVYNRNIKEYTVYVHELATRVYPAAYPEEGASVVFGEGRYVDSAGNPLADEHGVELPPVQLGADGAYPFPANVSEMLIRFTTYKEHREDSGYTVLVSRRGVPGKISDIKITVAEWKGPSGSRYRGSFFDEAAIAVFSSGDKQPLDYAFNERTGTFWSCDGTDWTDTNDTGEGGPGNSLLWSYETENFVVNFDAAGLDYEIKIPYYAQKVLVSPVVEADIITSYKLYPQNPKFFPEHTAIEYSDSATPQIFDFTRSAAGAVYQNPQLRVAPPPVDAASGLKTTYLHVTTAVQDPPNEPRYPSTYKFTIRWDKSLAYLKGVRVEDDISAGEQRLQGNFIKNNSSYRAITNANAAKLSIKPELLHPTTQGQIELYDEIGGTLIASSGWNTTLTAKTFDNFSMESAAVCITTEDHSLFTTETNYGHYTYWIEVSREKPLTFLTNLKIEGWTKDQNTALDAPHVLYWYEDDVPGRPNGLYKADIHDATLLVLKEPDPATPPGFFNPAPGPGDETNYTFEVDGSVVQLRITGTPESGGSVSYNIGDNPLWNPAVNTFDFSGGTGVSITAAKTGSNERVYAFTVMRVGAMAIELLTDMRDPNDSANNPIYTASAPLIAPQNKREPNSIERGSFRAVVRGKEGVNNAMPGETVYIRASPRLGWTTDSTKGKGKARLLVVQGSGTTAVTAELTTLGVSGPYHESGRPDDEMTWSFTMPNAAVSLILQYDFVTEALLRVAYVAPAGRVNRSGPYGSGADSKTGTAWAYATNNLQGVIDAFDSSSPGSEPFDEIWLLEGTYYLDPNKDKGTDWAAAISDHSDERNRAFVLKKAGLRIYGGFTGTEGGTNVKTAREMRHDTSAGAVNTVLSGMLRSDDFDHPENNLNIPSDASRYARHVVIAAGITSHETSAAITARTNFDTPPGYNFEPALDSGGIYGGAGVTLLDTLTVSNGIGTMDNLSISAGGKTIDNNKGAGIYNIDSSIYLRNVRIIDCNSVDGSGMYTTGDGTPVLKTVSFTGNRSFLYEDRAGHGAGMAVGGGKPVLIDCLFRNNASVGGHGAGMYISGGSVFLRGARFELNNTSGSGSFYNAGTAWIFGNSEFKNNTGGGIVNANTLKLANVTIANNGLGLSNSGTLSGTNLAITNSSTGISNSSQMAITNATISSNSTGVNAAGGVTVLANTVLNANSTGLSFALGQSNPDDITEQLKGCILFNVTITGGTTGVSASYSSAYSNNHGAASLLLNNVRISGASGPGLALAHTINSYTTNPPRDNRGLYVTLNNVTITGNTGGGITMPVGSSSFPRNIAAANAAGRFDELNLRVRNSIILGNGSSKDTARSNRFVVGSFGFGSTQVDLSGNKFYLNPDKAPLLAIGDAFRIAKTTTEGGLRTPVYIVTDDTGGQITYDATPVYNPVYPVGKTEGFALGDSIVKTVFTKSQFELGTDDIAPDIIPGENIWYLDPAHGANVKLHINDVFRMGNGTAAATGASFNTIRVITLIPGYFPTDTDYLGKGSWGDGDGIAADYPFAEIGKWVYNEFTGTRWERINDTGTGLTDWNNTGTTITPADKHKVTFTAGAAETITAGNKHIMTGVTDTVPGGNIVNLAGHTLWQKTIIGGVDEAVTGSAGLITGVGVLASAVFDADFRLLPAYTNKGDNSLYPLNAASLVSQLYGDAPLTPNGWGYKFKGGGTSGQEADMTYVLNNLLYTWLNGVYEKVTGITGPKSGVEKISLGNDNGGSKGDQRAPVPDGAAQNRINGVIDIGAYEK